ncbi:MAG TPA: hypothetical protein VLB29_12925 [Nocardioidaceae bacterium]|nr:hypothetical protein [Nocardioidaceae bacterium]
MSSIEAAAFVHMLNGALARHLPNQGYGVLVRLPPVDSYTRLATVLRQWEFASSGAVLLRDHGTPVRVVSVEQLQGQEPWPPRGILAAADATWVLEPDRRVTRLY